MHEGTMTVVGLGEVLWDLLPAGRKLGGAPANFAYHAQALGARGVVASCIGTDALGREVTESLERLGLTVAYVTRAADHPTGTVEVKLDERGHPSYTIIENVAWDFIPCTEQLRALARRCEAVCFGSLAQRCPTSRGTIRSFLQHTPPGCLRVFDINLRQHFYDYAVVSDALASATVLKLNDDELPAIGELLGLSGSERDLMEQLATAHDLGLIALTRGDRGSMLLSADDCVEHPGFQVDVADTVGAGDAFTAALTVGLLRGLDLERISVAANRLAGFVCTQSGATPPIPAELAQLPCSDAPVQQPPLGFTPGRGQ